MKAPCSSVVALLAVPKPSECTQRAQPCLARSLALSLSPLSSASPKAEGKQLPPPSPPPLSLSLAFFLAPSILHCCLAWGPLALFLHPKPPNRWLMVLWRGGAGVHEMAVRSQRECHASARVIASVTRLTRCAERRNCAMYMSRKSCLLPRASLRQKKGLQLRLGHTPWKDSTCVV